jgi:hypothetical protein
MLVKLGNGAVGLERTLAHWSVPTATWGTPALCVTPVARSGLHTRCSVMACPRGSMLGLVKKPWLLCVFDLILDSTLYSHGTNLILCLSHTLLEANAICHPLNCLVTIPDATL